MSVIDNDDLQGSLGVRSLSVKAEGSFVLYQTDKSSIDGTMLIYIKDKSELNASISVRVKREKDFEGTLQVVFRQYDYLSSTLDVVASEMLNGFLEVRPNNRAFGMFEILPAPRTEKSIVATEDSTTRSRPDLMTINYGDNQRMMTGQSLLNDGTTETETLEAFIKWNNLESSLNDMSLLEIAQLRLYYTSDFKKGTNIELHYPNTKWSEFGVTHANKPVSVGLITNQYTINETEKYIEFDVVDLVNAWLKGTIYNFGIIIKSNDDIATSFYTREGRFKPSINVRYFNDKIMSLGRAEVPSTMFIWATGISEPRAYLNSTLTVHSDYGFEYLASTLYVHTPNERLVDDVNSNMIVTKPEQYSTMRVAKRDKDEITLKLIVRCSRESSLISNITVGKPDQVAWLTVDPNMSLASTLVVSKRILDDTFTAHMDVTKPELTGMLIVKKPEFLDGTLVVVASRLEVKESFLTVIRQEVIGRISARVRDYNELSGTVSIKGIYFDSLESKLTVSKPDMDSMLTVRAFETNEISSTLTVVQNVHGDQLAFMLVSNPELSLRLTVRKSEDSDLEGSIEVPNYDWLNATLMIHQKSEIQGTLLVRAISETEGNITISKPQLWGFLYPRVIGYGDFVAFSHIRQRDASDLNGRLVVGGQLGAYYFII